MAERQPSTTITEPWTTRWGRRAISLSVLATATVLVLGTLPVVLPVLAVADLVERRPLPRARALAFLAWFLVCEVAGVSLALVIWLVSGTWLGADPARFLHRNFALQAAWARWLFFGGARIFSWTLEVDGLERASPGPIYLFMRHASTADSVIAAAFVSGTHGIVLRYVLKRELLWDPCLDIVGNRLRNCFIRRGGVATDEAIRQIVGLIEPLGPRDGILIYPEGTRFTPRKRASALEKLARSEPELLERASRLGHVLPPRLAGPLALLAHNPGADVVFCGHVGFEGSTTIGHFWRGGLVRAAVRITFWRVRAADIPTTEEERTAWLYEQWQRMDTWIAEQSPTPETQTPR